LSAWKPAEEPLCSASISSRLHQDVDYVAVLIDRAPEILQLAVDSKEDFVQTPVVADPASLRETEENAESTQHSEEQIDHELTAVAIGSTACPGLLKPLISR